MVFGMTLRRTLMVRRALGPRSTLWNVLLRDGIFISAVFEWRRFDISVCVQGALYFGYVGLYYHHGEILNAQYIDSVMALATFANILFYLVSASNIVSHFSPC